MMRRIAILLFVCAPAMANTPQIIFGGSVVSPSNSATSFSGIMGPDNVPYNATEANVKQLIPAAGTWSGFQVCVTTAPGAGTSYAVTARMNGGDTAVTATISGTSFCASDIIDSTTTTLGTDFIDVKVVPTGTPAITTMTWNVQFTPTVADNFIMMQTGGNRSFTGMASMSGNATLATIGNSNGLLSPACTIQNLFVQQSAVSGTGATNVYSFTTEGNTSAVTCSIAGTSATSCSDVTHSSVTTPGQNFTVSQAPTGTPTGSISYIGLVCVPTTSGQFPIGYNSATAFTAVTRFMTLAAGTQLESATEQAVQTIMQSPLGGLTLKNLFAAEQNAPGVATSYVWTLRKNAAATALTCTISGATAKTCNDTADIITVAANDLMNMQVAPTGSPGSINTIRFGLTGVVANSAAVSANRGLLIQGGELNIIGGKLLIL